MRFFKKCISILLVSCLAILSLPANVNAKTMNCIAKDKDIAKMMDTYIKEASKQYPFNGSILVAKKGKIIFNQSYGMADYEKNIPNRSNTKFSIASLTKQFVAAGVMMLQERQQLNVTDSISKYFPDYPNGNNITIHHLLTHTSGIADYLTDKFVLSKDSKRPYTVDELITLFKDQPPYFQPGAQFGYSNSNYVLLGKIIEIVSGKSCESFLEENIFIPVGMENTGFYIESRTDKNRALEYKRTETGIEKCSNTDESMNTTAAYTAGGMYSTAKDLYLWDRALSSNKLLSKESLDKIYTTHAIGSFAYGYGVCIGTIHDKRCIFHSGGLPGIEAYIFRYVDDDTCIVMLSNLPGAGSNQIEKNLFSILNEGKYEQPAQYKDISLSTEVIDCYVGKYEFMPGIVFEVTREGDKVCIQEIGSIKNTVYPYSQNEFYYKTANEQLRFENIKNGKAQTLIIKEGDSECKCTRVE